MKYSEGDRVSFGCEEWQIPGTVTGNWKVPLLPIQYVRVCFDGHEGTMFHSLWLLEVQLKRIEDETPK